jgi:hypothetical protein
MRHSRPSSSYNRVYDQTESALRALSYGTWPVPSEFYRDYIAAWLGPILEFTFAQQRCVNAWIIAQYGLTRQEVEGVPELDWLRTLLSRGCPLDVFAHIVEHESIDGLLQLVQRRPANDDEFTVGTFPFDFAASWVDFLWLRTLLSRGCPLDVFTHIVEHESIDGLLQLVQRRPANDDEFTVGTFPFDFDFSIKWSRNGIRPGRENSRRSPTRTISFGLMITHLRRGDTHSRTPIAGTMNARTYSGNDRMHRVR